MALGFSDSTTLVCLGTTSTELFSDRDGNIDKNTVETLFTTTVSTVTTSIAPDTNARLDATRDYVSSMSVQEIDQMLLELDEKEIEILNAVDETAKVKTLGSKIKF